MDRSPKAARPLSRMQWPSLREPSNRSGSGSLLRIRQQPRESLFFRSSILSHPLTHRHPPRTTAGVDAQSGHSSNAVGPERDRSEVNRNGWSIGIATYAGPATRSLHASPGTFGHLQVLRAKLAPSHELTLSAERGEILSILGPSGCGKTTTLRMIAGLEQPSSGRILSNRQDITAVPARARNMGMVFQNYALFPHLDVFENIAFGLKTRRHRPRHQDCTNGCKALLASVRMDGLRETTGAAIEWRATAARRSGASTGDRARGTASRRTSEQPGSCSAGRSARSNSLRHPRTQSSPPFSSPTINRKHSPLPTRLRSWKRVSAARLEHRGDVYNNPAD